LDPSNVTIGQKLEPPLASDPVFRQQLALEDTVQHRRVFRDLEANLCKAINLNDEFAVLELLNFVELSLSGDDYGRTHVMRILWKSAIQAEPRLADTIINSKPFNLAFVDDINGRTSLHEAALAGELRLVNLCIQRGIKVNQTDAYGRTALHYACMNGHHTVSRTLLMAGANADAQDMDNETPIIYAIINGRVECVRTLIDSGVAVGSTGATGDHNPLSLSCQHGHIQVALFLLQHGAKSLPNTSGEFPIHLAARDGHADLCRLLVQQEGGYKDVPDKYNEWTPLFHAACHGHDECVEVLLAAGANPLAIDELGKTPVYHASWFGHIHCTNRLLQAMASYSSFKSPNAKTSSGPANASVSSKSPNSDVISPLDTSMGGTDGDLDADMIPSLSLPPPIMPFRIYGHNYLDNTFLVQVVLGHPFTSSATPSRPPVHLLPSVARQTIDHNRVVQPMAPSFKLVLTSRPDEGGGATMPLSHSIILPLADKSETFTFQVASLDELLLEFSVYPTFGSRPIGRAIQAPHALRDLRHGNARVIPILDHRLHLIGEVLKAFMSICSCWTNTPMAIGCIRGLYRNSVQ
jgi:CDK inhibitor PHO81